MSLKLAPLVTEIEISPEKFQADMKKISDYGIQEAERISDKMTTIVSVGDKMQSVGTSLMKGVTLPLAGAGTAAVKMAMDFEDSVAKVSTIADTSKVSIDDLKEGVLNLSSATGESATELNEALYQAISASVDTADAVDFLNVATMAAVGGFTDNTTAVNGLTTVLNSYGMEASEVETIANQMLVTQNLGKTSFGELAASMGQVTPVAASLGVSTEELFSSLAVTTAQGLGTSESITALKGAMSNIIKPTSEAAEAAEALGIDFSVSALQSEGWMGFLGGLREQLKQAAPEYAELAEKVEIGTKKLTEMEKAGKKNTDEYKALKNEISGNKKTMEALAQASDSTIGGFATMFGSVEGLNSVLMLTSEQGMEKYNDAMVEMGGNTTALRDAYDKMDKAPGRQMQKALNDIKNTGIQMGDKLLPLVSDAIGGLRDLVDRFTSLSDAEQENILKWAGIAAATGPVLKIFGTGMSTIGNVGKAFSGVTSAIGGVSGAGFLGTLSAIAPVALPLAGVIAGVGTAVYGVHEYGELMNSTVLTSRDEMSWLQKVMADLNGVTTYTKEELQEMGYVHKDFSENISPEFQQAVIDSTKELQDFEIFLREIGFDDVFSEEESEEFNSRVEGICDRAIETINAKKEEANAGISEMFSLDDGVIDEAEQEVLDFLNRQYTDNTTKIQEIKDEVYKIKQKALEEGRELNAQEIQDINDHMAEIKEIELMSIGGTQEEILYAKYEFAGRVETLDIDSATQLMQEKAKLRDEEILDIRASYDSNIEILKSKLAEANAEEAGQLREQIKKHEEARDEKIKVQNDLYNSYLDIIKEKNPQMLEEINRFTGELRTNAEHDSEEQMNNMLGLYGNLNGITESGLYTLKDKYSGAYHEMAVIVDENTGEIVAIHDRTANQTEGYCQKMADAAKKYAEEHNGAYEAIGNAMAEHVDEEGRLIDRNGKVVGSFGEVREEIDTTKSHIVDINGTPCRITLNESGVIQSIGRIKENINSIPRKISVSADVSYRNTGGPIAMNHYNGLDRVPYDNYPANLHKDETVLTKEEADVWRSGGQSSQTTINFNGSYSFGNKQDIDYFMQQAALRIARSS